MTFGKPAWPDHVGRSRADARGVAGDLPVVKSATFGGPFAKMMTRRIVCREVVLLLRRTRSLLQVGARAGAPRLGPLAGPSYRVWSRLALGRVGCGALLVFQ